MYSDGMISCGCKKRLGCGSWERTLQERRLHYPGPREKWSGKLSRAALVRSTQQRGKLLDKWFCVLRCPKLVSVSIRLLPGSSAHFSKHVKQLNMLNPLDRISPARSRRGGRRVHRTHVLGLSRIWPLPSDSIATGRHGRCHLEPRWTGLSWSQGGDETVGRGEARSWMKK